MLQTLQSEKYEVVSFCQTGCNMLQTLETEKYEVVSFYQTGCNMLQTLETEKYEVVSFCQTNTLKHSKTLFTRNFRIAVTNYIITGITTQSPTLPTVELIKQELEDRLY